MSSSPLSDVASTEDPSSRSSFDRERILGSPPPQNGLKTNGDAPPVPDDLDPVQRLEQELQRTREEKDTLATQYRTLLAKLTTMRTTLGNKLKQDAVRISPPRLVVRAQRSMRRKNSTVGSS